MVLSEMTVPSHESQRPYVCVLGVLLNGLSEMTLPCHERQRSFICVLRYRLIF
jgi:hypothetical protein